MAKPLRVTQVLWSLGRGGAERMVFDLSSYLAGQGHAVRVLVADGGPMEADFASAGIPLEIAPAAHGGALRPALRQFFSDEFGKHPCDVLHTHLGGDIWAGWASRKTRIPWVMTAHSHEPDVPFFQRLGRAWAYRKADAVVCVSEGVRQAIARRYVLADTRLQVIRIGIRLERFASRGARLAGDIPHIVSVGRLVPEKGHATLLHALARIDMPWRLELVGSGPEFVSLHRLAQSLGILPRVHFTGLVSDPSPILARADLFCLPSFHEGQGLALFEAAASGVPAIASDLPSIRETFDEQSMAFASPGDVDAWSDAIRRSLVRYGDAIGRAERARRIIESRFSLEAMGRAYESLYRSLL